MHDSWYILQQRKKKEEAEKLTRNSSIFTAAKTKKKKKQDTIYRLYLYYICFKYFLRLYIPTYKIPQRHRGFNNISTRF